MSKFNNFTSDCNLAGTAPQDVVAAAEDVDVVVQVHPIDGVSPELMGNCLLLIQFTAFNPYH